MKKLLSIAAFLVAIALTTSPAQALDNAQTLKIKKTLSSATLLEMPAIVALLITQSAPADREAVALMAVETAVFRSPASAPMVVAAIAKAAPDLTDSVVKKSVELEPAQTSTITLAANRGGNSGRGSVHSGNGNGNSGNGNSGRGNGGNATGRPGAHNPGPPLPENQPHHNRPNHPHGGPPGLVDYSKPRHNR